MPALSLTPAERKALRGQAHHLDPVVLVGSDGLTPAVLKEADAALKAHGLIKVRMFSDQRAERELALGKLAEALHAAPVQHIGKLLVLWRPVPVFGARYGVAHGQAYAAPASAVGQVIFMLVKRLFFAYAIIVVPVGRLRFCRQIEYRTSRVLMEGDFEDDADSFHFDGDDVK